MAKRKTTASNKENQATAVAAENNGENATGNATNTPPDHQTANQDNTNPHAGTDVADLVAQLKQLRSDYAFLLRRTQAGGDNVLAALNSNSANAAGNSSQDPLANVHRTENQTLAYNTRAVESEQSSFGTALSKAFIRHDRYYEVVYDFSEVAYDETSGEFAPRSDLTLEAVVRLTHSCANLRVVEIITEPYSVSNQRAAEDMGLNLYQAEGFKTLPQVFCHVFACFFRANDVELMKACPAANKRNVTRNLALFLAYPTCDCSDLDEPSNPLGRYRGADDWTVNLLALLCAFHHCVRTLGSGSSTSSFGFEPERIKSAMNYVGKVLCLFHNAAHCCFHGTDTSVILATAAAVKYNKALGSTLASDSGAFNFADESDEKCRSLIEAAKAIAFPQSGRRERSPVSGASATGSAPSQPEGRGLSAQNVNDRYTEAAKKIFVNHVDYGPRAVHRLATFLRKNNTTVRPSADSQVGQWLAQCEAAPRSNTRNNNNNNNNRNQRNGTTNATGGLLAAPSSARS